MRGIKETLDTIGQASVDIVRGLWNGLTGMVIGLVTIGVDVGIVAVSNLIPDLIEPKFLKEKADETFDGYKAVALQLIQDPRSKKIAWKYLKGSRQFVTTLIF